MAIALLITYLTVQDLSFCWSHMQFLESYCNVTGHKVDWWDFRVSSQGMDENFMGVVSTERQE